MGPTKLGPEDATVPAFSCRFLLANHRGVRLISHPRELIFREVPLWRRPSTTCANLDPCIGRAHSRDLPAIAEHERPCRSISHNTSAQGTSGPSTCHHRDGKISAQGECRTHCRRVRSREDVYGTGHDPRSRRVSPKYHAGDVPLAHHAQVGPRGPAHDSARAHFSYRRHAQRRRSQPAAWCLRSEVVQRQDGIRGQAPQLSEMRRMGRKEWRKRFPCPRSSSPAKTKAS